jgi:hypothetical protein
VREVGTDTGLTALVLEADRLPLVAGEPPAAEVA